MKQNIQDVLGRGERLDSVAAKFATTSDMKFLCTTALNDDIKATTALCILAAPAEHSAPFVRAIAETGAPPSPAASHLRPPTPGA